MCGARKTAQARPGTCLSPSPCSSALALFMCAQKYDYDTNKSASCDTACLRRERLRRFEVDSGASHSHGFQRRFGRIARECIPSSRIWLFEDGRRAHIF